MYVQQPFIDGKFMIIIIMFINMLMIAFVEAFPYFFTRYYYVSATCLFNYSMQEYWVDEPIIDLNCTVSSSTCYSMETQLLNAFFLYLMVSVDDDNSPQWRKLAWSQDCSMLACSYRFVMYWLTSKCLYT